MSPTLTVAPSFLCLHYVVVDPKKSVKTVKMAAQNATSISIRTGFQPIFGHHYNPANEKKGCDLVPHVFNVEEIRSQDKTEIVASVIREMSIRDNHFRVTFEIDSNSRLIKSARCSCVAGCNGFCKHSFAVYYVVNHERTESCTDRQQEWLKPSQKLRQLYPKGKTIQALFQQNEAQERDFSGGNRTVDVKDFCLKMKELGLENSSMFKMFTAKPKVRTQVQDQTPVVDDFILSMFHKPLGFHCGVGNANGSSFFDAQNQDEKQFYDQKLFVSADECSKIFKETLGQAENPLWFVHRKNRITASTAHKIIRARSREQKFKYFHETFMGTKSMQHGKTAEPTAREQFSTIFKKDVLSSGLVISQEIPWIACTPDGLIKEDDGSVNILEIKCPSSCKDGPVSVDYIEDGKLKENHAYYFQVQLQMYLCKAQQCYFFVFTYVDFALVNVQLDPAFL